VTTQLKPQLALVVKYLCEMEVILVKKIRLKSGYDGELSFANIYRVTTTNKCKLRNLHNVCHQVSVFGYEGSCIQEEYI
jgi:hypothetical protein